MVRCTLVLAMCLCSGSLSVEGGSQETLIGSASGAKGTTCPCGMPKNGRIAGGSRALPNVYPWMLKLVITGTLEHICGASIIDENVAITATHCTRTVREGETFSVIAGTSDVTNLSGAQIVRVARWIEHENYKSPPLDAVRTVNDISLLLLAKPLVFNGSVGPVCLPIGKMHLDNQWVKLTGWGRTGSKQPTSKQMIEVDFQVLPFSTCLRQFPLKIPQTQICTRATGRSSCMGDSGGPVTWLDPETNRYTLVGLVSFGSGECIAGAPSVHTEVAAFLPWIKSKIGSLGCQKSTPRKLMKAKKVAIYILSIE